MTERPKGPKLKTFELPRGRSIGKSYKVESKLGGGSEGEVYQICDQTTGISRAAKIYFPHRDPKQRLTAQHARKLNQLRDCQLVLQFLHTQEVRIGQYRTMAMISELCEGEPLQRWIERHKDKRVDDYVALTILHRLVAGLEQIHAAGQYHSDVHTENILIEQSGIDFRLKLIDFYEWGKPTRTKMLQDILGASRVLYDMLGGRKFYKDALPESKYVCAGLRSDLILERFPTASSMRHYLETFTPTKVY
ncbi:MAG TPA: lipopolysaccharide kinase InaA family protein [Planctomycetota bacterium]|nr:lipopolysaccharide kinase InaA family protein [Planctomycetota bacterium]HRV80889.1 lipopolysaccharide kinase InaA family protein [Planctomycetota bacterium]